MKKNRLLKILLAGIMGVTAACTCFFMAACGGDDNKGDNNGDNQGTNQGTNQGDNQGANQGNENQGGNQSTVAVDHTYTYSYTALTTAMGITDDGSQTAIDQVAVTAANFTAPNDFLTLGDGSVFWRCLKKATGGAIEVKNGGLKVTFQGTGTITISFGSTSSSNTSGIALLNAAGEYMAPETETTTGTVLNADTTVADGYVNKANLVTKAGGQKAAEAASVTYTITAAGTYTIYGSFSYMESGVAKSRGTRVWAINMVDKF